MTEPITQFIEAILRDLSTWDAEVKPWFRGESDQPPPPAFPPLCPKISKYTQPHQENYLLQSFRRQAGAVANVPPRQGHTDLWLFLAQHYRVPTRLLDWTEGALHALYFALNQRNPNPRVYMLNPPKLNELAGVRTYAPNYPLTWTQVGGLYVALAWQHRRLTLQSIAHIMRRDLDSFPVNWDAAPKDQLLHAPLDPEEAKKLTEVDLDVPLAFPATYQDQRMIAQRSCFTIHGNSLDPIQDILTSKNVKLNDYLFEYKIDENKRDSLLKELSILGVSAATIFPDLDHLAPDLEADLKNFNDSTTN